MREGRFLALLVIALSLAAGSCEGGDPGAPSPTLSSVPSDPSARAFGAAGIADRWVFDELTGVPPDELPARAVKDNRPDLVIERDGTFRWGDWSGTVAGAGRRFALDVAWPPALAERFDDHGASIGLLRSANVLEIWMPDLGQDRDVDIGAAVEDIDSPDMAFVRG